MLLWPPRHADGSLKFWDASAVTLQVLYKLKTAKIFDKSKCQQPDSEDDPFAIQQLFLDTESRYLVAVGLTHLILFKFSKQEATLDLPVCMSPSPWWCCGGYVPCPFCFEKKRREEMWSSSPLFMSWRKEKREEMRCGLLFSLCVLKRRDEMRSSLLLSLCLEWYPNQVARVWYQKMTCYSSCWLSKRMTVISFFVFSCLLRLSKNLSPWLLLVCRCIDDSNLAVLLTRSPECSMLQRIVPYTEGCMS